MKYEVISADCHIDLIWLPPDLFTSNARKELKDRMPYVTETSKGPRWVSKNGGNFGLVNGMGSAGREYVPAKSIVPIGWHRLAFMKTGARASVDSQIPSCVLRIKTATASRRKCFMGFWVPVCGSTTTRRLPRCFEFTTTG